MIRPWVEFYLYHYDQLKKLKEKTEFVRKKDYPVSTGSSYLPRASRDNYRTITASIFRGLIGIFSGRSQGIRGGVRLSWLGKLWRDIWSTEDNPTLGFLLYRSLPFTFKLS